MFGARIQSVKADLPSSDVVFAHWRSNPRIFCEAFEELSQKEELHLWGDVLPKQPEWFRKKNVNLYTIQPDDFRILYFNGNEDFRSLFRSLSYDSELKKIIKVLGSKEFLEKVLSKDFVEDIVDHISDIIKDHKDDFKDSKLNDDEKLKIHITFKPHSHGVFSSPNRIFGGNLDMEILMLNDEEQILNCSFIFDFEKKKDMKKKDITVLKNCLVSCAVNNEEIKMKFIGKTDKPNKSSRPWTHQIIYAPRNAKNAFASTYKTLRDAFQKGEKEHKNDDHHDYMGEAMNRCCASGKNTSKVSNLLRILITDDFLNGIFGKEFWSFFNKNDFIIENYLRKADFEISEYARGLKVDFILECQREVDMKKDFSCFPSDEISATSDKIPASPDKISATSDYIHFVFFYEPQKDEISHVRLQDKLILNYELITQGEPSDIPLEIGDKDDSDTFLINK